MKRFILLLALLGLVSTSHAALVLDATTDKIQVVLTAAKTANDMECMTSWRDITTTAFTPGKTLVNSNGTTDADLVGSPGASTQRVVDYISVYNADTASKVLVIKFDANGTEKILWKGTINAGEMLYYDDRNGFRAFNSSGAVKQVSDVNAPTANTMNTVVLAGDVINQDVNANTMADVTGLSFAVTANKTYWFRFSIAYTSAIATTGSRWSINGPAKTSASFTQRWSLAQTTTTDGANIEYDYPAAANTGSPANLNGHAWVEGFITPSANGTVIARFASEITGSAITAKAGSILQWIEVI